MVMDMDIADVISHSAALSHTAGHFDDRVFPPIGAEESKLLAYRDRVMNRWSVYRNGNMSRIGLGFWYLQGRQWAELDTAAMFDGVRGVAIRDIGEYDDEERPRPVTNEIDVMIEAELRALVKRRWTFKVIPTSDDPSIKAAAKISNDVLNHRLIQLRMREKRVQHALYFAAGGLGTIYTYHDRSYAKLRATGAPSAVYCECGTTLASRDVPVDMLQRGVPRDGGGYDPVQHLNTARPTEIDADAMVVDDIETARLQYCPTCPDMKHLQPLTNMSDEDAEDGVDVFGRPLGVDVPSGETGLDIDLPWEVWPENGGARMTPWDMKVCGRRKIRSLEWIEERYPHLVHRVDPDSVSELLYGDPMLGGFSTLGMWSTTYDSGIFDYHANVDEVIALPSFRHPLGRYLACTRDVVLEDGPLLEKAIVEDPAEGQQTLYVPRAEFSFSRCKPRATDFFPTTLIDNEISKQNRLNGVDAMIIEARLRNGLPNWLMPRDMWTGEGPTNEDYGGDGGGKIWFINPSLSDQGAKPISFGGELMPADIYMERDRIQSDMQRSGGPGNASQGLPVKNMKAASGLQMMIEQDEQTRALREDEVSGSWEKSTTHIMRLEWAHRADAETYRVLGPDKTWSYDQYKGNSLRGQYEVTIERGAFVGRSIVQREAAREALADKVVVIDTPLARKRLAEMYGLDTDINEDTSNQVDHAERIFVDFRDKDIVRRQDMVDDAYIHYVVLGARIRTEEVERIADESGWEEIQSAIAGWEDDYRVMIEAEAKSFAFYGGRLVGDEAAEAYARAHLEYQSQLELFEQQRQVRAQLDAEMSQAGPEAAAKAPPTPALIPPKPPPVPIDLPGLIQDRIMILWLKRLKEKGWTPPTPHPATGTIFNEETGEPMRDPMVYVEFRALFSAYAITAGLAATGPGPGSGSTMIPVDKGGPAALPSGAGPGAGPGAAGAGPAGPSTPPSTGPMPGGGKN